MLRIPELPLSLYPSLESSKHPSLYPNLEPSSSVPFSLELPASLRPSLKQLSSFRPGLDGDVELSVSS